MIDANSTVDNHYKVHKSASLLDILIEFDQFLDDLNVYSYHIYFMHGPDPGAGIKYLFCIYIYRDGK